MKAMTVTTPAGANISSVLMLDLYGWPNVSLQVVTTGGVYTVEQTLDTPGVSPVVTWFPHPDINLVNASANKQSNYAFVPVAIRLNQASGGPTTLTVIQNGSSPA